MFDLLFLAYLGISSLVGKYLNTRLLKEADTKYMIMRAISSFYSQP